jgi:hypothetical protein
MRVILDVDSMITIIMSYNSARVISDVEKIFNVKIKFFAEKRQPVIAGAIRSQSKAPGGFPLSPFPFLLSTPLQLKHLKFLRTSSQPIILNCMTL